jgi:hypothetical protein
MYAPGGVALDKAPHATADFSNAGCRRTAPILLAAALFAGYHALGQTTRMLLAFAQ